MILRKGILLIFLVLLAGCITRVTQNIEYAGLRNISRPISPAEISGTYCFIPKANEARYLGLSPSDTVYLDLRADRVHRTMPGFSGMYTVSKMILTYVNDAKLPYSNQWQTEGGAQVFFRQHKPTPNAARFFIQQRARNDTLHLVGYFGDDDRKMVYRVVDFKKIK